MHPHAQSQFDALAWHSVSFRTVGQLHLSDATISLDEMIFHQKRSAESDLKELIWLCRDRYCFAIELINPRANPPDSLFDRSAMDLSELFLPWAELCAHYRWLVFDPQIDLFEDQRVRELRKWGSFLQNECFTRVTDRADWTRCVLETAGLLPLRSPGRDIHIAELFDDLIENMKKRHGEEIDQDEE